jgi:aminoglycoside phosphotransferase (APT) family kinase protein
MRLTPHQRSFSPYDLLGLGLRWVVMDAFALPDALLADYLSRHIAGFEGPLVSSKFQGGQSNPTYLLKAASGNYVLRRKPPGPLLASAHAVDREFRVLGALAQSGVPVARELHLCSDEAVIGSMFYVMSHEPGRIFWDPSLPDIPHEQRCVFYDQIVDVLADLHRLDVVALGLGDFGKPGNYFARQLKRWSEQYRLSEIERIEPMEQLIAWLGAHVPADDGAVALVHGDWRIDNLIFHAETPTVRAIVDWELATLGHPLADLGYFCMALRLPRNPVIPGLMGLDRAALGLPDEHAIVARYEARSGRRADHWKFILAFNFFRLAAIAQGVAKRAAQGNASSAQAIETGRMVPTIAALGLTC